MRYSPIHARSAAGGGEVRQRDPCYRKQQCHQCSRRESRARWRARDSCERFAETAELLAKLRARLWEQGIVTSTVMKGKETAEEEKFRDYYAYSEAIRTIPSHRALALFRGETWAC